MNYNSLMNKPTINYRELIGDNTVTEVGGITEEKFDQLLDTDLSSYYTKAQINELFARSFIYKEKSGSIVTFDCPTSTNGISEVTSEIEAVQAGNGDPSPTNVRPITGWSAVNVVVSPTTDAADGTTYTTTLKDGQGNPMTCYGGTLDVVRGVLTVDRAYVNLGDLNWTLENGIFRLNESIGAKLTSDTSAVANMLCSIYKTVSQNDMGSTSTDQCIAGLNWSNGVRVKDSNYTDVASFKQAMNGVQLVYPLATPQTIPQDNLAIASSAGINNIWSDSGDITVKALDRIIQG